MATAPTFITEAEVAWNSNTSPKTSASLSVQTGDVLVAIAATEEGNFRSVTVSGGGLTWTLQKQVLISAYCWVGIYTTIATSTTSFTVAFAGGAGAGGTNTVYWMGGNVLQFRGSDGVGASSVTNVASGAPSLALTTSQDNSAIVCVNGDYNAADGTVRTWRTINGSAATEQSYFRDSVHYTIYGGYWPDAGTAGAQTTGLSAPTGQKYAIVSVEIKGAAAAATRSLVLPSRTVRNMMLRR